MRSLRWSLLSLLVSGSTAFVPLSTKQSLNRPSLVKSSRIGGSSDNDQDWDRWDPKEKEQSQMPDFIASFLDKSKSQESKDAIPLVDRYTHMIGVPLDESHDLTLELESVQRAILYHCPVLVHACIVPAMTRMPLLYVEANDKTAATVTKTLHDIVERVVRKQLFQRISTEESQVDTDDDDPDRDIELEGVNADGHQPLMLSFQNLEIDGKANEVLHTVAKQDARTAQLVSLVTELRSEIEALGWKTAFPPDDHVDKNNNEDDDVSAAQSQFRPRVPFMRLPDNFDSFLEPLPDDEEEWSRTSDRGGNGISPIFWYQWWEDVMARQVRMREIGIYPRQPGRSGLSEQAFYIPHESTELPRGNEALTKAEARHRGYHEQRLAEAEGQPAEEKASNDEIVDPALMEQRQQLESIYSEADDMNMDGIDTSKADDIDMFDKEMQEEIEQALMNELQVNDKDDSPPVEKRQALSEPQIDDWTKERIRKTVEARASVQARRAEQKDQPAIEENPVFQSYKEGTLVDKKQKASGPKTELPDYPSREHFAGFWRVVTPPTGFPEEIGDDAKSDNLILRIDGTTAGGPTLDPETRQKASGGTWKFLNATEEDGVRLKVRLVIPPKKERILVMEGEVTRFLAGDDNMSMTSSTFGIPELEAAAQKQQGDLEDLMHCGGPVWVEDAVTGKNREEIGVFSLMKLSLPTDPSQYTITIPRPVRNQD